MLVTDLSLQTPDQRNKWSARTEIGCRTQVIGRASGARRLRPWTGDVYARSPLAGPPFAFSGGTRSARAGTRDIKSDTF